jgi:hypothetical protein
VVAPALRGIGVKWSRGHCHTFNWTRVVSVADVDTEALLTDPLALVERSFTVDKDTDAVTAPLALRAAGFGRGSLESVSEAVRSDERDGCDVDMVVETVAWSSTL